MSDKATLLLTCGVAAQMQCRMTKSSFYKETWSAAKKPALLTDMISNSQPVPNPQATHIAFLLAATSSYGGSGGAIRVLRMSDETYLSQIHITNSTTIQHSYGGWWCGEHQAQLLQRHIAEAASEQHLQQQYSASR